MSEQAYIALCGLKGPDGKWKPGKVRRKRRGLCYCSNLRQLVQHLDRDIWEFVDLSPDMTDLGRDGWELFHLADADVLGNLGRLSDLGAHTTTRSGCVTRHIDNWNARSARRFAIDCARLAVNHAGSDYRAQMHEHLDLLMESEEEGPHGGRHQAVERDRITQVYDDLHGAWARATAQPGFARNRVWSSMIVPVKYAADDDPFSAARSAAFAARRYPVELYEFQLGRRASGDVRCRIVDGILTQQASALERYLAGEPGPFVEAQPWAE